MDCSAIARWEVRKAFIPEARSSHGCNADFWLVRDGRKCFSQMLLYESTVSIRRQESFQNTDSLDNLWACVLALREPQCSLEHFLLPTSLTSGLLSLSFSQLLLFHVLILARHWDNWMSVVLSWVVNNRQSYVSSTSTLIQTVAWAPVHRWEHFCSVLGMLGGQRMVSVPNSSSIDKA